MKRTILFTDRVNSQRKIFFKVKSGPIFWQVVYPKKYRSNGIDSFWDHITKITTEEGMRDAVWFYRVIGRWK